MKTLLILRHAKSGWKNAGIDDHERPLKPRGERDANRIGRLLRGEGLVPDLIVTSTAVRARTTAELLAKAAAFDGEVAQRGELYDASPHVYVSVLRDVPDHCERVMVVGHNPVLEDLLAALTGHAETLPTAALARVDLDVDRWTDLNADTKAVLVRLWRPKELD